MTLALIYDRVSTPKQSKNYSLESQLDSNKRKAVELGATDFLFYEDSGFGGDDIERPGLTEFREAVRQEIGNLVVIYDPDRLARKLSHQLLLTEEIEKAGLPLYFVNSDYKDTPEGKLFYSMRGAFAEYEKEKIKERTERGKKTKLKKGGFVAVPSQTFGFIWDKEKQQVLINGKEAEVIKLIFNLVGNKELSTMELQHELFKRGIPTKKGLPTWERTTLLRILHNPIYIGSFYQNKWETTKKPGKKYRSYKIRDNQEEWIQMSVPPIITQELFDKVQIILKQSSNARKAMKKFQYLLTGILTCGICGKPYYGGQRKSSDYNYRYYVCRGKNDYNKIDKFKCSGRYIPHQKIDEFIWDYIKEVLNNPSLLMKAGDTQSKDTENSKESLEEKLKKSEEKIASIKKNKLSLLNLKTQGLIDEDELTIALEDANKQVEFLNEEIIAVKNSLEYLNKQFATNNKLEQYRILVNNSDIPFEDKRMVVKELIQKIIVLKDGNYEIIFKITQPENFVKSNHNYVEYRLKNDKNDMTYFYKKVAIE